MMSGADRLPGLRRGGSPKAAAGDPAEPGAAAERFERANQLARLGRFADAAALYEDVLRREPRHAGALANLGTARFRLGDAATAIDCYRRALALAPDQAGVHANLGHALRGSGDPAGAAAAYAAARRLAPRDVEILLGLGLCLYELGRLPAAGRCFAAALRLDPRSARAANNLAGVYKVLDRRGDALRLHERAARLDPRFFEAHENVGKVHEEEGRIAEARAAYRAALTVRDDRALALHAAILCPPVFDSGAALDAYWQRVEGVLDEWQGRTVSLDAARVQSSRAEPPVDWSYHGRDLAAVRRRYAALFADALPRPALPARPHRRRVRVGFVVTPSHEGVFARCMSGIITRLDQRRCEPVLVCTRPSRAALQAVIPSAAAGVLEIPLRFDGAVAALREAAFDVLYYWEVGTDSTNYFLPFCRLAPVQCTGWGWPDTSGAPELDVHLSSAALADPADQRLFTEHLVRLPHLPPYFFRPSVPPAAETRAALDLPARAPLYVCAQNLRKVHPDLDAVLGEILRRDRRGVAVFVHDRTPALGAMLLRRWRATLPDVADRIRVLPRLTPTRYFGLLACADVLLDTPHFAGALTAYDAFAAGTPVVTLGGTQPRGRYTAALYQLMDLPEAIAATPADYVARAVRLANDRPARAELSRRIGAAAPRLFESAAAVVQLEAFFVDAARRAS